MLIDNDTVHSLGGSGDLQASPLGRWSKCGGNDTVMVLLVLPVSTFQFAIWIDSIHFATNYRSWHVHTSSVSSQSLISIIYTVINLSVCSTIRPLL